MGPAKRAAAVVAAAVVAALLSPGTGSASAAARPAAQAGAAAGTTVATATTLPSSPTSVRAVPGIARVAVSWGPPSSGPTVRSYDVSVRRKASSSWTSWRTTRVSASTRSLTVYVANGVVVEARVRAVSSAGAGSWSATTSAKAGTPKAPPVTTSVSLGTLKATWTSATRNASPVTAYRISYRRLSGSTWSAWSTVNLSATARSWTRKMVGTTQVRVLAINKIGAGPYSSPKQAVVPGRAVRLAVTVTPGASPLSPGDITVEARDAAGHRAASYRGTVGFVRSMSPNNWGIADGVFPASTTNIDLVDIQGSVPGPYTFTSADAGRRSFPGGWSSNVPFPWGLTVTDSSTSSITGRVRYDVPTLIEVRDGRLLARVSWGMIPGLVQVMKGTARDPLLHGASLEFYDTGAVDATSLPGAGGLVRAQLPAEGWTIENPVGDGTNGFGYRYTGGPDDVCTSVLVMPLKVLADCSAAGLTPPLAGSLQMWLQLGAEAAGPAYFCPQWGGSWLASNTSARVTVRGVGGYGMDGPQVPSLCLTANDDEMYVTDPMSVRVGEPPASQAFFGDYGDEWAVDVLANDQVAGPGTATWSLDLDSPNCVADLAWADGYDCGLTAASQPSTRRLHVFQPGFGGDRLMRISSQPDCGLQRPNPWGPSSGVFDGVSGQSCTFDELLTVPYTVSDSLHTARATVSLVYDTPPSTSVEWGTFDTELSQTAEGARVCSATLPDCVDVPAGTGIQVTDLKAAPGPTIDTTLLTGKVVLNCITPNCTEPPSIASFTAVGPVALASLGTGPASEGLVLTNPELRIVRQPLVVIGDPNAASPFRPVLIDRVPVPCNGLTANLQTCGTAPPLAGYTLQFTDMSFMNGIEGFCQVNANGVYYDTANTGWRCDHVALAATEAEIAAMFQPFCVSEIRWSLDKAAKYDRFEKTLVRFSADDWRCNVVKTGPFFLWDVKPF